jgi:hypothetical protein
MFPERYVAQERASTPRRLGRLAEPWSRERRMSGTFGAADLLWLFRAPGGKRSRALDDSLARAAAWGGGRVEVWTRDAATAVAIVLARHSSRGDLCESVLTWYGRAFPDAVRSGEPVVVFAGKTQHAVVACTRREVRVGIAPEAADARRLVR